MSIELSGPVLRYLEELEPHLKDQAGVTPEDALRDAREFLQNRFDALQLSEPGMSDEEIFGHFVDEFGSPESFAAHFGDEVDSGRRMPLSLPKGFTPGWRICCTKCGRSAPASKVGIVRIGARSRHKYTLGFCSGCRQLRFLQILRDLDRTNLTDGIGADRLPDDLRRSMHRPVAVLVGIIAFSSILAVALFLFNRDSEPTEPFLQKLPKGWKVDRSIQVSGTQRELFEKKFNVKLEDVRNSFLHVEGQTIQVNTIRTETPLDATKLARELRKGKSSSRLVQQRGRWVVEFVTRSQKDVLLAHRVRYELGIQPPKVKYKVEFEAAPLDSCDPMKWNEMFNLFLRHNSGEVNAAKSGIEELSRDFVFGNRVMLRRQGQGQGDSKWTIDSQPLDISRLKYDVIVHEFPERSLPKKAGVEVAAFEVVVTSETNGASRPNILKPANVLRPTAKWPADDPKIRKLASRLTAGAETDEQKVQQLLDALLPGRTYQFGGKVVGSRYGVDQFLKQKRGHCWDFSDLFVSLCRASGVPCRQVLGWLHLESGHVWAEVLLDGKEWRQVDPTAGGWCGSDYVPYLTSEDGEISLVYTSLPRVTVLEETGSSLPLD